MKQTRLTLKEVFMREEGAQDSRFIQSMRKQFGRAPDQETLDHVAEVYDRILATLNSPPNEVQNTLAAEDPFFKFHFRIAYQEFKSGILNPEAAPSGKSILESELEKRHAAQAEKNAGLANTTRGPDSARRAAYGGDVRNPRGLGS